ADTGLFSYITAGFDNCGTADNRTGFDHCAGADPHPIPDLCIRRYSRTRMDADVIHEVCQQPGGGTSERELRVSSDDDSPRGPVCRLRNNTPGAALADFVFKPFFGVAEIVGTGIFQAGDRLQHDETIAQKLAAHITGKFLCSSFHAFLPRYSATARAVRLL